MSAPQEKHLWINVLLPALGKVDPGLRACYAEQSQITLMGNLVHLMTKPKPFPDQQISPLARHPHELSVAVLVSNCQHILYIVQLHPLTGTVFGKALLVK